MGQRALDHWDNEEKKQQVSKRLRRTSYRHFVREFHEDERSGFGRVHHDVSGLSRIGAGSNRCNA